MRIVGITPLSHSPSQMRAFLKRRGITYPAVVDPGEKVIALYGFRDYPAAALIDRRGILRFVHTGFRPGDEKILEGQIRAMLAAPAG